MNFSLLDAAKNMRALLNTIPVNYVNPRMCMGDLETWDAAIKRAEEAANLPFVAQDGYHSAKGWCVVGPFGGVILNCDKEIQAKNTADALNQIIAEKTEAAIRACNSHDALVKALKRARYKIEEEWGVYASQDLALIDAALNSTKPSQ